MPQSKTNTDCRRTAQATAAQEPTDSRVVQIARMRGGVLATDPPYDLCEITEAMAFAQYRRTLIARWIAQGKIRAWVSLNEVLPTQCGKSRKAKPAEAGTK